MSVELLRDYINKLPLHEAYHAQEAVIATYGRLFHPGNLATLTAEEFRAFLRFENNQHWHGINRQGGMLTEDMVHLREALAILLDESRPIADRLDQLFPKKGNKFIKGLGRAVATPILLVVYPDRYGVYNSISESGLRQAGLYPDIPPGASFAEEYSIVNHAFQEIAGQLDISLWMLDALWSVMIRDNGETDDDDPVVIPEGDGETVHNFALERHLSDFLYRNWQQTTLGQQYELYEEGGDLAQEYPTGVGRIDLLARNPRTGDYLVIELKRSRSSDAVVGQIMRYMGWVKRNLAQEGEVVYGAIIVPEADEKLRYSLTEASSRIQLYVYRVEFFLDSIQVGRA
jgi:hypothetical protein